MTLQASGGMTIADINTELERDPAAIISTDDADMIYLAGKSNFAIPSDFYGKTFIGNLQQEYALTLGATPPSNSYGTWHPATGTTSPTTYRGSNFYQVISYDNTASYDVVFSVAANVAQSQVTALHFVDEGVIYRTVTNFTTGGGYTYWFFGNGSGGPWDASDNGASKTLRVYGN